MTQTTLLILPVPKLHDATGMLQLPFNAYKLKCDLIPVPWDGIGGTLDMFAGL